MHKMFKILSDSEILNHIHKRGMDFISQDELDDFIFWFHQKIRQWKDRIKSLPPFLENLKSENNLPGIEEIRELDKIISWIQKLQEYTLPSNIQSELHNLERQTYVRCLNYRKYHQHAFSPDEILDWLGNNPYLEKGRLSDSARALRSQAFYRKLDSFKVPAAIKWFDERFEFLEIDEINEFLNWYQNHKPYPEEITENVQKILQKSKDKIFKSIREEVKLEKNILLENYPFLEELSLGEITILGQGNFATIIGGSSQQNTVIKIPNDPTEYLSPEGYVELVQEAKNHREFQLAIAKLKRAELIPDWLAVPKVFNAPEELPSFPEDMLYTMEKVHGLSLKRLAFLRLPQLRDKLGPFSDSEIRNLSELAFEVLLKTRKMTTDEFKTSSGLVPPLFFEVFTPHTVMGKKFQNVEDILVYMREHEKVIHTDLHSDNILIDEETETLYLIDFGIVITSSYQR